MRNKSGKFQKGHPQFNTGRTHFKKGQKGYWLGKKRGKLNKEWKNSISKSLRGIVTWNKGLTKETDKRMEKLAYNSAKTRKGKFLGKNASYWKGGRINDKFGYTLIYSPAHPFKNYRKYVREHRLVMEQHLERFLNREEIVHHINGMKSDNRIENLKLFSNESKHQEFHHYIKFAAKS